MADYYTKSTKKPFELRQSHDLLLELELNIIANNLNVNITVMMHLEIKCQLDSNVSICLYKNTDFSRAGLQFSKFKAEQLAN